MARKRGARATPRTTLDAQFRENTAYKLGCIEGKIDVIIQRVDVLTDVYKVVNHNTTEMTERLTKIETRQDDAEKARSRSYTIIAIVLSALGVLVTWLGFGHPF